MGEGKWNRLGVRRAKSLGEREEEGEGLVREEGEKGGSGY